MFLRNYDNLVALICGTNPIRTNTSSPTNQFFNNAFVGSLDSFGDGNINLKTTSGNIIGLSMKGKGTTACIARISDISNPYRLCFGSGSSEVSYDDYELEAPITHSSTFINNLFLTNYTVTYDATAKSYKQFVTCTINNTTNSPMVISEWGMWIYSAYDDNDTESKRYSVAADRVLLSREVLDEPITIPANGGASFNLVQYIPMANHP